MYKNGKVNSGNTLCLVASQFSCDAATGADCTHPRQFPQFRCCRSIRSLKVALRSIISTRAMLNWTEQIRRADSQAQERHRELWIFKIKVLSQTKHLASEMIPEWYEGMGSFMEQDCINDAASKTCINCIPMLRQQICSNKPVQNREDTNTNRPNKHGTRLKVGCKGACKRETYAQAKAV